MPLVRAATFPLTDNLAELNVRLSAAQIPFRIAEEQGMQVVWLADDRFLSLTMAIINGEDVTPELETTAEKYPLRQTEHFWVSVLNLYPFTVAIIVFGLVGYLLVEFFPHTGLTKSLFFSSWSSSKHGFAYWRVITPAFIHFGFFHFLFNSLWVWEMGRRIERWLGKAGFIFLFLFLALGSNYIQYWTGGGINFGGLSGVVYGFLGFLLVAHYFIRNQLLEMPPGIYVFMLLWLGLGFFGAIDIFIQGGVANGAHLGGLVLGLIAGFFGVVLKWRKQ